MSSCSPQKNVKVIDGIIQMDEFALSELNCPTPEDKKIYLHSINKDGDSILKIKRSDGSITELKIGKGLEVLDPTQGAGVPAAKDSIGVSIDSKQWVKVGELDTDWRQFLTGEEDGTYSANIELADVSDVVPPKNVLGMVGNTATVGNGTAQGGVQISSGRAASPVSLFSNPKLDYEAWRKAVKYLSTRYTSGDYITVKSTTGYAVKLNYDGTYGETGEATPAAAVEGPGPGFEGDTFILRSPIPVSPFNNYTPKFYAVYPCDASGNLSGDLTYVRVGSDYYVTALDLAGLSKVTAVEMQDNYTNSTSLNLTGMSSLTLIKARFNQLTSFDWPELHALEEINLEGNQITSFNGVGLGVVESLVLYDNKISSFSGVGLNSVLYLYLDNNLLTSFDGAGLDSIDHLELNDNQLTSVVMDGQDLSFAFYGSYGSSIFNNNLDFAALVAFLESLGTTTTGIIQYGNNPGSAEFETYLTTADDKGYIWFNTNTDV